MIDDPHEEISVALAVVLFVLTTVVAVSTLACIVMVTT